MTVQPISSSLIQIKIEWKSSCIPFDVHGGNFHWHISVSKNLDRRLIKVIEPICDLWKHHRPKPHFYIEWIFGVYIQLLNDPKPILTQFQGPRAILKFSWKSTCGPSVIHWMNFLLIYLCIWCRKSPYRPNFKVDGENWNFLENQPVDSQYYIVGIFRCQIRSQ